MTALVLQGHAPRELVAFGSGGSRTAADMLQDVGYVADALPQALPGSQVLCVVHEDRYVLAVSVLAAWLRGHAVALAPDAERAAVLDLVQRAETCAVLHDTSSGAALRVDRLLAAPRSVVAERGTHPLPLGPVRFYMGGAAVPWVRMPEQLALEASVLAQRLSVGSGARLFCSLAADHPYAFVTALLLPLLNGGAFARKAAVGDAAAGLVEAPATLVSVPAHLAQLAEGALRGLCVVSSLAPLSEDAAARLSGLGAEVCELFTTPAHGSLASRVRSGEGPKPAPFVPLDCVSVNVDEAGRVCVRSPFLAQGLGASVQTEQLAKPAESGGFFPLGRADERLWAGDRQLTRTELTEALQDLPELEDVAVLVLPRGAEPSKRLFVALVGSARAAASVNERLAVRFGPACRAERVVSLAQLPRTGAGTLSTRDLCAALGIRESATPVRYELDALVERDSGHDGALSWHSFRARVPSDYGYFEGHFPGYPILPAAAQLADLVMPCVRRARGDLGALSQMLRLKFLGRILPGDEVCVQLRYAPEGHSVDFTLHSRDTLCSSGHLVFRRAGAVG